MVSKAAMSDVCDSSKFVFVMFPEEIGFLKKLDFIAAEQKKKKIFSAFSHLFVMFGDLIFNCLFF